jgi:NarL family two-component system sensor histidine kinase YdfH
MERQKINRDRLRRGLAEGGLFFVIESLVIVFGYVNALRDGTLTLGPARVALFSVVVAAHVVALWLSPRVLHDRRQLLIFLVVQAALAFAVSLLVPEHWLALALYMGLTGLGVAALWPDLPLVAVVILVCLGLSTYHLSRQWGWRQYLEFLPTIGLSLAFVVVYVISFTMQTQARERAQELLSELEVAHRRLQEYADRVEELTISQERQRMAQELHDTLAQGVAGLILQLEAADHHLENDNAPRAQETIQRAMVLARTTLREARRAIQALRPAELEREGLIDALGRQVEEFAETTGIRATLQVDATAPAVAPDAAPEILRIVQESLANVARHAQAEHVRVRLEAHDGRLRVSVEDDGAGFDAYRSAERPGAYGIRGMKERAQHIGAELEVRSAPGQGTTVTLEMEVGP